MEIRKDNGVSLELKLLNPTDDVIEAMFNGKRVMFEPMSEKQLYDLDQFLHIERKWKDKGLIQ